MKSFFIFISITSFLIATEPSQSADYIFFGGEIMTMDLENPSPETVAISNGKIIFVGDKKKALFLQTETTEWINLQKGALLPGFIATSSHLLLNGLTKYTLDLSSSEIKTFGQVEEILKEGAKHGPVLAMGYNPSNLSRKQKMGFKKLEKLSDTYPILVINKTGEMAYGNRKAFSMAGIDENYQGGDSILFQKNKKGRLTGVALSPEATLLLLKPFEQLLKLDMKKILARSIGEYAKNGYTTIVDDGFSNPLISLTTYLKFLEEINTPSTVAKIKGFGPFNSIEKLKLLKNKPSPFFKLVGIQINIDGSLQNYQALLKEKYKNKKTSGISYISRYDLTEQVLAARQNNLLVKMKASGDEAISRALFACEKAQIQHFNSDQGFILEQASLASQKELKQMIGSHVCPTFSYQDLYLWGEVLQDKILGSKRTQSLDVVKSCLGLDLPCSIQEGGALGNIDPFSCIRTFISRQSIEKTIINQDQKITLDQAIKSLTIDSAKILNLDSEIGSIKIGKNADFLILNKNPRRTPLTQLTTLKVIETWVDGKRNIHNR